MKVLIVDDSKPMRMIVAKTLRQAGFRDLQIMEAGNGKEGLEMIGRESPDFVLVDWNMPEMTGLEMTQALKEKDGDVKLGFITSEHTPEMKRKAMDAGALFLITKPFTAETFQDVLGPYLD